MRKFLIAGLTGPSGSGKSTVSKFFEKSGYTVINADKVAREIMDPDGTCLKQLSLAFGSDIINSDGTLNRRKLAEKAFADREKTQLLNDITHPQIFLRTLKLCRESIDCGKNKILFDAPVLFESNSDIMCDAVVSVIAPREVRIERLTVRDGITREEIERRLDSQQPDEFYISRSDYVIDGGEALSEVEEKTNMIIKRLRISIGN